MSGGNKVVNGFLWRLAERLGAQGVTFVVSIVLARLLDPEVYGTIALVTVFTTILQVFVDSGLGTALVQKKDADDVDFSTVFYCNLVVCGVLYAGIFFAAPLIAAFYDNPDLTPIIRVLSLTLVISGVRNVQQAYVSRELLFKKYFFATLGGTVVGAGVGLFMAYSGMGVWALVGQQIINALVGALLLWIIVRWRPILAFSFQRLKGLFSFGWKLLAAALLDTGYNQLRQLIIGKLYTEEDLAYYNKGNELPNLAILAINSSIDSVLLPTMSKEQDDRERVRDMTRKAIRMGTYIIAPMMIGLVVCAEPFIRLLLTEKWLDCVFYLRICCISYMFYPIHTANLNAIKALGRSDWFFKLEIAKKLVGLVLLVATMFISVEAMTYSLLLGTLASTLINTYPNRKLMNYTWGAQMKDILPNVGLALLMGVPVFFLQYLPLPTLAVLVIQVLSGMVIYFGLSAIFKNEIFFDLLRIAKSFLRKKKNQ